LTITIKILFFSAATRAGSPSAQNCDHYIGLYDIELTNLNDTLHSMTIAAIAEIQAYHDSNPQQSRSPFKSDVEAMGVRWRGQMGPIIYRFFKNVAAFTPGFTDLDVIDCLMAGQPGTFPLICYTEIETLQSVIHDDYNRLDNFIEDIIELHP
jgi:hypothetical protein